MKVAVSTINNYLSRKLTTEQMVAGFDRTEVEVEEISHGADFDKLIVTARVVELEKHPQADRLALVTVEVETGSRIKVVCGAPNVVVGQIVVLAKLGAKLPDGLEIKKAVIRGVESAGMLCSPAELGISDDHSGIMVLPANIGPGKILCDIWPKGDYLDIKTQPNRWDHLSWIGLAREASGYVGQNGQNVVIPENPPITYKTIENVNVKKTGECRRFVSVRLSVNNGLDSPKWLVDNLEANGQRSINPVVDITNFVMLETGQPSHAYDAEKINGRLAVRRGSPAEKITTLDGAERTLSEADIVIADDSGAIGLAGVIGGISTQVDADTTQILLEVANFDRELVRKTALRHGLRTEASARFERSLPLPLTHFALPRLISLLREVCQAEIMEGPFDQLYGWPWTRHVGLRLRRAERVLGMEIDQKTAIEGLRRVGFEVEHFSLSAKVKQQLGKPYVYGASFKKNGADAFDCSYLTSYIYSLIGKRIGETSYEQYKNGQVVSEDELKAGDLLFISGHWTSKSLQKERHDIGHVGIYMGQNKVIHAARFERYNGQVQEMKNPSVVETSLSFFTNNPGYKGARRYIESFNHILAVTAPWWRTDIILEEDLIEEVIKIIGYDKLPATTPLLPPMPTANHQLLIRQLDLKKSLAARGLFEVMTYSFVSSDLIELVGKKTDDHLEILNPLSREQQYLRRSLLASHLRAVESNQHYKPEFGFFELSRIYLKKKAGELPDERWVVGVAMVGKNSLLRLKGELEALARLTGTRADFKPAESNPATIGGRSGEMTYNGRVIGQFGQVGPTVLNELKIDTEVSFGEIEIEPLLAEKKSVKAKDLLPYSPVARDLAIEVDASISWADIEQLVARHDFIDSIQYLNDFADDGMRDSGRKSIAFRVGMDMGARPDAGQIASSLDKIIEGLRRDKRLRNLTLR